MWQGRWWVGGILARDDEITLSDHLRLALSFRSVIDQAIVRPRDMGIDQREDPTQEHDQQRCGRDPCAARPIFAQRIRALERMSSCAKRRASTSRPARPPGHRSAGAHTWPTSSPWGSIAHDRAGKPAQPRGVSGCLTQPIPDTVRACAILGDAASRRASITVRVYSPADQLNRLLEIMSQHRISLGIIPSTGHRHTWLSVGFWIVDRHTVHIDTAIS